jgi:hypothetical protein
MIHHEHNVMRGWIFDMCCNGFVITFILKKSNEALYFMVLVFLSVITLVYG